MTTKNDKKTEAELTAETELAANTAVLSGKEKEIQDQKSEADARIAASKDDQITALLDAVARLEKSNEDLTAKLKDETARAEAAEKDRDAFRSTLQQEKVGTVQLEKGEAQLVECVTIPLANGGTIDARVGDVLLADASEKDVAATRTRLGGSYRVHSVKKKFFTEVVDNNLATVRR